MNSKDTPEIKHFDNHKIKALNVLLKCTVIGGVIFALINYQGGQFTLASMELIVSIVAFILLIYLKHHNNELLRKPGTIANVMVVPLLIWALAYNYEQANENVKETLIRLASRDHLTDLYNRRMMWFNIS